MERAAEGYTIIEVLIVIAISALLFLSALVVVRGQNGETEFTQAMQDISSKIQSYANEVSSGSFSDASSYSCAVSGGRPALSTPPGGSNPVNNDCVVLGRAIHLFAQNNSRHLLAYTVLGTRDIFSGGVDTGKPATDITQTGPEPAIDSGSWVLMDDYLLVGGITVRSSTVTARGSSTPTPNYYLVGLYTSLESGSAGSNGAAALSLRGYPIAQDTPASSTTVQRCIEENAVCPGILDVQNWQICFSENDALTAILTVNRTSSGGVTTQLSFVSC